MGTQTGGRAYRKPGRPARVRARQLLFGASQGIIEAWTESLPLHTLLGDIAEKSGLVKTILHQAVPEIAGEEIATALQDLNEWAIAAPRSALLGLRQDRPQAFVDTVHCDGRRDWRADGHLPHARQGRRRRRRREDGHGPRCPGQGRRHHHAGARRSSPSSSRTRCNTRTRRRSMCP